MTAREAGSGLRLLPPVELTYPRGLVQAAMLMNYSRIPAFIPDYRHVLWPERYHNRMGLFCFLFPGYPNQDYPFGWRACDEELDPDPELVTILDPRLKTEILPRLPDRLRRGARRSRSRTTSRRRAPRYGWPMLVRDRQRRLRPHGRRRRCPASRGSPRAARTASCCAIRVETDARGPHVVILGGRRLERARPAASSSTAGRSSTAGAAATGPSSTAELAAGPHVLELPSLEAGADPEADYLYFAAVVQPRRWPADYVSARGRRRRSAATERR